jgi:hypothetical protein
VHAALEQAGIAHHLRVSVARHVNVVAR